MLYISFTAQVNDANINKLIVEVSKGVNAGEKELTLLMSTPGGWVSSGVTIFNIFKVLPVKKIFWNIGNIDSIGVMMFLAGDERYAVPQSRFLFHEVKFGIQTAPVSFSEREMLLNSESLKKDKETIVNLSAAVTKQKPEFINEMMELGKILKASEAMPLGYVHKEMILSLPDGIKMINIID